MIRSQVLLTPKLNAEIKSLAKNQKMSQSEIVRRLLGTALAYDNSTTAKKKTTRDICDLASFTGKNPRINGFKEIFSVGGKTHDIKIVQDSVFRTYKEEGSLPQNIEFQIIKLAEEIKNQSLTKKLVVRRAYVVPGLENPPGPRFLGLDPKEVVDAIKEVFDFAIEHEYYSKKGSQVCAFFYPFADPEPVSIPLVRGVNLPYGGYAVPLNTKSTRVEVLAVWGNNEGVQSFDAIDRYIVDAERRIILEKNVPQKMLMFCTTENVQSDKIDVPQDRQFEQILSDYEILETARIVNELTGKYGMRRVEFSFDGKDLIFNESVPYEINDGNVSGLKRHGFIKKVSTGADVLKLSKLPKEDIPNTVVYIDRKIVETRAYDVLNSVAGLSNKFVVLYPGLSATAHAMRVLTDFGHTAITVGTRSFEEGEEVIIDFKDGQVVIEQVSKGSFRDQIVNLHDAKLYGRELVGGKALNLSVLKSKGFNVPHGVVLTTKLLTKTDINWENVLSHANLKSGVKYAVRSSANVEDSEAHSFAGQFETFLNVNKVDIEKCVKVVVASSQTSKIRKYAKAANGSVNIKMAVIIQEMVDVEKSGVVFGKDVQTGNEDLIVVDVALGLGEGVVEGTAKTQRIIYSRSKDRVLNKLKRNKRYLSRMEIDSLVEMTQSIENLMGGTQDIEWAIDKSGSIWIIQTRDL